MATGIKSVVPFKPQLHKIRHRLRRPGPLPNLLIAGASRSGSTSLWHYLREHPDIFMPPQKEIGFFDNDMSYQRGLSHYRRYFSGWRNEKMVVDATPRYFMQGKLYDDYDRYSFSPDDDAASRIATCLPDVKSILTLRNPVDRAFSMYRKACKKGKEHASSFRAALEDEVSRRRTPSTSRVCYLYANDYARHVGRWLDLFPPRNVKIIVFEKWTQDPANTLQQLYDFMGVRADWLPEEFDVHNAGHEISAAQSRTAGDEPVLDVQTRNYALNLFKPTVRKLQCILDRCLDGWDS